MRTVSRLENHKYAFTIKHNHNLIIHEYIRFDLKNRTWDVMASLNVAQSSASAVVMNGLIYVAGGQDEHVFKHDHESYDPANNAWLQLAPMKYSRYSFALIQLNGFLYAIGGLSDKIEKYGPSKNEWKNVCEFDDKR